MGSYPLSYSLATSVKASWVGPTPRKEMEMEGDSLLSDRPPPPLFLGIFMKKKERKRICFLFSFFFPPNDIRENVGWGKRIFPFRKPGLVSFVRGSRFQVEKLLHEYSGAVGREERGTPWFSTS